MGTIAATFQKQVNASTRLKPILRPWALMLAFACISAQTQAVEPYKNRRGQMRNVPLQKDDSWSPKRLEAKPSTRVSPFRKSPNDYPAPYARSRYTGWHAPRR
jgi:hypothetical protein